jgi:hypothetical protein
MLKAIHAQESRATAEKKANAIIAELRAGKMSKAAELVEQTVYETLTYYTFPDIRRCRCDRSGLRGNLRGERSNVGS